MNAALLSSKNMNWCTPQELFAKLDQEFHFDLDPAATDKSAKCAKYYTPADDGLSKDWGGCRVFCNPPYGRHIQEWVRKGYEESQKPGTLVVMLIPARTDTSYFHDYIFGGKADEVRFLKGRIKFTDEDGNARDAAPFPSAVIVWRSPCAEKGVRMMEKIPELKPCPFCGGRAIMLEKAVPDNTGWYVACTVCKCRTLITFVNQPSSSYDGVFNSPRYTSEQAARNAANMWNQRVCEGKGGANDGRCKAD